LNRCRQKKSPAQPGKKNDSGVVGKTLQANVASKTLQAICFLPLQNQYEKEVDYSNIERLQSLRHLFNQMKKVDRIIVTYQCLRSVAIV
jgi:hypothetical protein